MIKSDDNSLYRNNEYFGINLREKEQLYLMDELSTYFNDYDINDVKTRYHFPNYMFSRADALILFAMLMKIKPTKLIEVGSGFSSAVTLDANELYFNNYGINIHRTLHSKIKIIIETQ